MSRIQVLDCTLRDGGYCNEWRFLQENIHKIINGLVEADVDIIECGFLTDRVVYDKDVSKFTSVEELAAFIPENRANKLFVCMTNYGEYDPEKLPACGENTPDGLRVAFHKKDVIPALALCEQVKAKGYKVFVQAMVSLSYSDEEFLSLIRRVNDLKPYAFYIVDSFGMMKRRDLLRLFRLVEENLADGIKIGFHSHNNMQLAYSNAQALVELGTDRDLIIDASIYGMGRGAGNLNTELFVEYLNDHIGTNYQLKPLLTVIDETLSAFYARNYWGYSLPNYLSAKHNVHPNYANHLDSKKTLTVENMDEIFSMINEEKRCEFDRAYIEELYGKYMATGAVKEARLNTLTERIRGKQVLIIAPGKSSVQEKDTILRYADQEDVVTISINFDYPEIDTEFIFLSNLRRFRELDESKRQKCIVTSNIPAMDVYLQTKYSSLINSVEAVKDNAGLMLIKLLISLGAGKILIAGMDGYSVDPNENFADQKMSFYAKKAALEAQNEGMCRVLQEYAGQIDIALVTTPRHVTI